jgi:hypothetical protein
MMGQIYSECLEVLIWMGELETAWIYWSGTRQNLFHGRCYDFSLKDGVGTDSFKYMPSDGSGWQKTSVTEAETFPPSEMVLHMAAFLHEIAWGRHFQSHFPHWGADWQGPRKEHFYKTLHDIRTNNWFTRLWTVQELILAPRAQILLGPVLLPLETLLQAKVMYARYIKHKDWPQMSKKGPARALLESGISSFTEMAVLRSRLRQKDTRMSLLEVRLSLAHRLATMDVDQVFALLGLRNLSTVDSAITADYNRKCASVYTETCREHINQTSSLATLSVAGFRSWDTMPSWAIVLSPNSDPECIPEYEAWGRLYSTFNAARGLGPSLHHFVHDSLIVRGVKIDHVMQNSNSTNADRRCFRSGAFTTAKGLVPGKQKRWEEIWFRTLCADSIWPQSSGFIGFPERLNTKEKEYLINGPGRAKCADLDPWLGSGKVHKYFGEVPGLDAQWKSAPKDSSSSFSSPTTSHDDTPSILETSIDFTLKNIFPDGCVFRTYNSQIGLCNNKIRVNDEIFIVAGCNMPLVMERIVEGRYKLKGACYLNGYMNEELNVELLGDIKTLEIQ